MKQEDEDCLLSLTSHAKTHRYLIMDQAYEGIKLIF